MYARIMGKLNARRQNLLEEGEKGFTLIELLVVVIIIGILAAIAIPVYLGVQENAKDSSVQSDVANAKTAAVSIQTNTNALPAATTDLTAQAWKDAGATVGKDTKALTFTPVKNADGSTGAGFCVQGTSDTSGATKFAASDSVGATKGATCNADGTIKLP